MENAPKVKRGIYLISPETITDIANFLDDLKFIFENTLISIFQLRLKNISNSRISIIIETILPLCRQKGIIFVINDNLSLAQQHNCDGLHLGKEDVLLEKARKEFNGLIGVSCYSDINRALYLSNKGASYVSFGAFFSSMTKPNAPPCAANIIEQFKYNNPITPVCAIGGINSENCYSIIKSGADLIALSSAIWSQSDNNIRVKDINFISNQIYSNAY